MNSSVVSSWVVVPRASSIALVAAWHAWPENPSVSMVTPFEWSRGTLILMVFTENLLYGFGVSAWQRSGCRRSLASAAGCPTPGGGILRVAPRQFEVNTLARAC